MLVHNGVLRDARVLKEAKTLWRAGYAVDIHGIHSARQSEQHQLDGTDIRIFLNPRPLPMRRAFVIAGLAIAALCVLLLGIGAASASGAVQTALLVLFVVCVLGGVILLVLEFFSDALRPLKALLSEYVARFSMIRAVIRKRTFNAMAKVLRDSVARQPTPDIIHIHDHIALGAAKALKKDSGAPLIWDAHEIYEDLAQAPPYLGRLNASIIRKASDCIDRFITISDSFARFYAENYKKLPRSIIVRNATEISPPRADDGRLHEAAGLPRSQRITLYQGGFATHRGLEGLVAAAAHLHPSWSVVMMGWGPIEERLRSIAEASIEAGPDRETPSVCFIPGVPQEDLPDWTAGATVGVIPYEEHGLNHRYCTPNKLWEYPNARVPIVASDLVELRKILDDWGIGWCLPKSPTPKDIADLINGLSDDEIARAREACARFVEADNWGVYEARLVTLYGEIARPAVPQH